jgi:hypothetical protein
LNAEEHAEHEHAHEHEHEHGPTHGQGEQRKSITDHITGLFKKKESVAPSTAALDKHRPHHDVHPDHLTPNFGIVPHQHKDEHGNLNNIHSNSSAYHSIEINSSSDILQCFGSTTVIQCQRCKNQVNINSITDHAIHCVKNDFNSPPLLHKTSLPGSTNSFETIDEQKNNGKREKKTSTKVHPTS